MGRKRVLTVSSAALAISLAAAAAASGAVGDLASIRADYRADGSITRCRFTLDELERARAQVAGNPDEAYGNFAGSIDGEIVRLKAKFCRGALAESARKKSSLKVDITSVVAKGGPDAERVKMKNRSKKPAVLDRARLRNRADTRVGLTRISIPPKSSLTVYMGCKPKGKRTGRDRAYACVKKPLLADKGDVLRLVDGSGIVAAQRGFERYAGVYSF